ncbi:hypothetical protein LZ30DRAFT_777013 [Colletotrichum cereale]|nr:hypothetical protein LZ30DRAFT_777013 [Colletotrichum cereale]
MAPEQDVADDTSDSGSLVAGTQSGTVTMTMVMATPTAPCPDQPNRISFSTTRPAQSLPYTFQNWQDTQGTAADGGGNNQKPNPERQCRDRSPDMWPCFVLGCPMTTTAVHLLRNQIRRAHSLTLNMSEVHQILSVLNTDQAGEEEKDEGEAGVVETRGDTV